VTFKSYISPNFWIVPFLTLLSDAGYTMSSTALHCVFYPKALLDSFNSVFLMSLTLTNLSLQRIVCSSGSGSQLFSVSYIAITDICKQFLINLFLQSAFSGRSAQSLVWLFMACELWSRYEPAFKFEGPVTLSRKWCAIIDIMHTGNDPITPIYLILS
jgi:hypothetical protein